MPNGLNARTTPKLLSPPDVFIRRWKADKTMYAVQTVTSAANLFPPAGAYIPTRLLIACFHMHQKTGNSMCTNNGVPTFSEGKGFLQNPGRQQFLPLCKGISMEGQLFHCLGAGHDETREVEQVRVDSRSTSTHLHAPSCSRCHSFARTELLEVSNL